MLNMSILLLLDDDEESRVILEQYLRNEGYEVMTAENGERGIELFQRERPNIVLTDINIPPMGGIEVLKRIKQAGPETEVIVITGQGELKPAIESLKLDASDIVTKPIGNDALSVALRRANERLDTRKLLKEYTNNLENRVKEAIEEVRERREFESSLIDHSIDGIINTDKQGNIIDFNKEAEKIFEYSKDEVVGKMDIRSLYPPGIAGIAEETRQALYRKKSERGGIANWKETFVLGKGGHEIPVRFSGTLLYSNGNVIGSVSFVHDLREIKRLEKELIENERLSAIGQTVAGLAHCIKNILLGMEGGIYVVDKGLRKNDMRKLRKGWDMVRRNIDKMSNLVLDLLSYSKERKPEYKSCSPNSIADEVCELMDSRAKELGIKLVRDFDPTVGHVFLDPKGIYRCLLNQISNAIDACIDDEDEGKEYLVRVTTRREKDGMVAFEVSDNGCGMDEEIRKQIFTGFFSTKGSKGTGLGLVVTHKILQEHGGTITVQSEPGKGSTFTSRLPYKHQEG